MDTPTDFDAVQLFQDSPDPMWVYDPATLRFLAVNAAAVAQYGYSRDEFLAMTIADIYPREDVEALRRSVAQNGAGQARPGLWRHRRKSGELLDVEIISQAARYQGRSARLVTARSALVTAGPTASRAQSRLRLASWELDLERNEANWPSPVYDIFGLDPLTWSNTRENFLALLHPEDRDCYQQALAEAIRNRTLFDIQYRARHASGCELVLHEAGEVHNLSGRPVFTAVVRDITDFIDVSAVSAQLEARLRDVLEGMSDAFYLVDRDWRFSYVNCNAETLLGRSRDELTGRVLWDEFPEARGTRFETALREARTTGGSCRVTDYYPPFGKSLEVTAHPGGEDLAVYLRDVTEEVKAAAQRQLINLAIARLNDVVLITEADPAPGHPRNRIIYANEAARRLTGYGPEELVGQSPKILQGPETPGPALDRLHAALHECGHAQEALINYNRDGEPYWVEVNLSPVLNEEGTCTHFIAVERDVTDRKNSENALRLAAETDHLTGLPNRVALKECLERELETVRTQAGSLALLFIDFDNFKNINDSLGHSVGDELLLAVSARLSRIVRRRDGLARFGGDEFVVIAPGADENAAHSLAVRLLEAFMEPFDLNRERVSLTASIGIVVAPEDGEDAEELIRKADIAMYRSKTAGRNQATQFDDALHQDVLRSAGLTQALHQALAVGGQFSLVYQPQYALSDEPELVGAEALLRWRHPERGLVSPTEFIPAAERAGLIVTLDRHVIKMAARQVGAWNRQGRCVPVSVNISTNTLEWDGLAGFILKQLEAHDVPPHLFGVEIIETRLLESSRATIGNLLELRRVGVSIAIDDFGTGHSSLSYLQDLPVDVIKIDQSFVQGLEEGEGRKAALVQAILAMACALKLKVVAEGVETEAQRAWLMRNHCTIIQGFLIGQPGDAEAFARSHLAVFHPPERTG